MTTSVYVEESSTSNTYPEMALSPHLGIFSATSSTTSSASARSALLEVRRRPMGQALVSSAIFLASLMGVTSDAGASLQRQQQWVNRVRDFTQSPAYDKQSGRLETSIHSSVSDATDFIGSIQTIRRLSGLTWDELAQLMHVTRRSLFNWASGSRVNAVNAQKLAKLAEFVGREHQGDAEKTRARLLAPQADGRTIFEQIMSSLARKSQLSHPDLALDPQQRISSYPSPPDRTGKLLEVED